jgi:DNA-binding response OmpR family regulator
VKVLLALEPDSVDRVLRALIDGGCEVSTAAGPRDAEHRASAQLLDAVVFDPHVLDEERRARIRRRGRAIALVAWLTTSSAERTAELLAGGADEAVHAAMGDVEIVARTLAAARRGAGGAPAAIEVGALRIDPILADASWAGRPLPLTAREREVLLALAESAGRSIRREVLYRRVWGYAMARGDRTVDVNVRRLRAKLAEATGDEVRIETQTGVGYRLELAAAVTTL